MTTFVEGEEIIHEEVFQDTSVMNETVIVDTWNGTTTTQEATISPEREKLYESLILSGSAIIFIFLAILIFYHIKTSRWFRHWWRSRRSEKKAKREEKARLKAKAEREKEDEEDEEEYSV